MTSNLDIPRNKAEIRPPYETLSPFDLWTL